MGSFTTLTLRLLLVVATASLGSCLGDQCSVVHYLAAGEVRDFSFRSGNQFVDNLHCIFSFSAPSNQHITLAVSDLDMAPPSTGSDGEISCIDDVLSIYDLTGGQLQAIGSYCGKNSTLNPEFVLSSNVAVVSFVSRESTTPRRFMLTLKSVEQMQPTNQSGPASEGQKEVETGEEQGNIEEGEGNGGGEGGEEEGAGEEESATETGEEEAGGEEGEENEGEEEPDSNEDEESTGDNRRQGKAVPKILGKAPKQGSVNASVPQKATRKPRSHHYDKQLATNKPRSKIIQQNKWQTAQAKVTAVRAHPAHNKVHQEDRHRALQHWQHAPQPSGHRKKVKRQLELLPKKHILQLWPRSQSVVNNMNHRQKHNMIKQKQKLKETIKGDVI